MAAYPLTRLNVFSASSRPLPAQRHTWSELRQRFTRPVVCRATENRLSIRLVLRRSPRATRLQRAVQCNELVAALADAVLAPYAVPGGRTEVTARNVLARGQPLFTFADESNATLIEAGAEVYGWGRVRSLLRGEACGLEKEANTAGPSSGP